MPPELKEVLEVLPEIPDIRVLQTCALRKRMRFGIYGGVIRNLLLNFYAWRESEPSVYTLIDPFADIDVLVEDQEDWPLLWEAIAAALPFAGFYRWEPQLSNIAKHSVFEMIPVDRFVLWIDGREGERASLSFDGIGIDVVQAWQDHIKNRHPNPFPEEWIRREDRPSLILTLVKLLRYQYQYPRESRHLFADIDTYAFPVLDILNKPFERMPPTAWASFRDRLELAVLDALFTTRLWKDTLESLSEIRKFLPDSLVRSSRLLQSALEATEVLSQIDEIGASVYRPTPRAKPRKQLVRGGGSEQTIGGRPPSAIPWTQLSVSDPEPPGCCRYRDFRFGAGVIAWRQPQNPSPLLSPNATQDYGAVAFIRTELGYSIPDLESESLAIPLPGLPQLAHVIVLRVDHGYVRSVAGRDLSFEVGLVKMESEREP